MPPKQITVVDIGAESLKVITLRRRKTGFEIAGAGTASMAEFDRTAEDYVENVARALNRVIKKNGIPIGRTVVGLSARGSMVRYLTVPAVPPWKLKLLMNFEVEEQVGLSSSMREVTYDYRLLNLRNFEEGQFPVFLALAQVPVIQSRLEICRQGRARAESATLQCLGAFNLFCRLPQAVDDELSLLLDLGAEETHLTLQEGGNLYFSRTLSHGGRQFTSRIQKDLELLFPEAEEVKCTEASLLVKAEESFYNQRAVRISQACWTEARILSNDVQGSLQFFLSQFQLKDIRPAKVFITGGGSRLVGLAEALSVYLQLPVEHLEISESVLLPGTASAKAALAGENAPHYATAAGLGLAYLDDGFVVSLLPPATERKRRFWSREVYVYYAAAVALVAIVLIGIGSYRDARYGSDLNNAWKIRLKEAELLHSKLGVAKRRNEFMYKEVRALQIRKDSPVDLLLAIKRLREKTPKDIFFTRLSTTTAVWGEIPGRRKPDEKDEKEARPGERQHRPQKTFQQDRCLLLEGYVVGVRKEEDGRKRLLELERALHDLDLFAEAKVIKGEFLESAGRQPPEKVKAAFAIRLFNAPGKTVEKRPPRGGALWFRIRCRFADET